MNEKEKQKYLKEYNKEKEKGVLFFPDILYKDAIVSFVLFIILAALAFFVGAKLEARADPTDTAYTPRPEWYFLFLFQLLKYFPGSLEVIGVVVIPLLAILFLILLPYLDRSPKRHFLNRPIFTAITGVGMLAIVVLTLLAVFEAPPPEQLSPENQASALYLENCSGCHGPSIAVPEGVSLHEIIAQGKHEGMPAWNADLSPDEIDTLVGFILRPEGSRLFSENCEDCHDVTELVESNPFVLKTSLDQGTEYEPHVGLEGVKNWITAFGAEGRVALLNFLIAPDGERLYTVYCQACHGEPTAFSLSESELRGIIESGEQHVNMPSWREQLSSADIQVLAQYVVDPSSDEAAGALFEKNCAVCHSDIIPAAPDVETATEIITMGGAHRTMPIWGEVLTTEQVSALTAHIIQASELPPLLFGQELYIGNCALCHGELGEGGQNPARSDDIIGPISSAEYLKTRDDFTLRMIIAQGQPNFGMSPFASRFGGPLSDEEVDAVVAYLRNWENNPPVEFPPDVDPRVLTLSASAIYNEICAQCHGQNGEGLTGPSFVSPEFKTERSPDYIFNSINLGHEASAMLSWGEILSLKQIQDLVYIIQAFEASTEETEEPEYTERPIEASIPSFENDVLSIFTESCNFCHGSMGGWDGTNYEDVINSGDNGPAVIPGDAENSLLAQKMIGTHSQGNIMPPAGKLSDEIIQIILDWIEAGAPDN